MRVFVVCVVCVCVKVKERECVCVCTHTSVCVMKRVYPYVFVSSVGSYEMGRHKQYVIIN